MPRFSANISMLFTDAPMLKRFARAAQAGFGAIEIQFPYDHRPEDLAAAKQEAGVEIAVFNLPVGDMLEGGPGLASMPGREDLFAEAVGQALDYARALRPYNVNVLAGWPPAELERGRCLDSLARNLAYAAEAFEGLGVRVTTEAVNVRDRPGYFLATTTQAMEAIDRADHPNLYLEHDLYHMQIMEGDLAATLERILPRIGHIQFADTPGRHEPGTGEINFAFLFEWIDRLGYDRWVGAEYEPTGRTEDSLAWLAPWLPREQERR